MSRNNRTDTGSHNATKPTRGDNNDPHKTAVKPPHPVSSPRSTQPPKPSRSTQPPKPSRSTQPPKPSRSTQPPKPLRTSNDGSSSSRNSSKHHDRSTLDLTNLFNKALNATSGQRQGLPKDLPKDLPSDLTKLFNNTKNRLQDGPLLRPLPSANFSKTDFDALRDAAGDYIRKLINETKDRIPSGGDMSRPDFDALRNSTGDYIKKLLNGTRERLADGTRPLLPKGGNWTKADFDALFNTTKEFIREKFNETKTNHSGGNSWSGDSKRRNRPSPAPLITVLNRRMLA